MHSNRHADSIATATSFLRGPYFLGGGGCGLGEREALLLKGDGLPAATSA